MDATSTKEQHSFRWPTEVLRALQLAANDVGLTATTEVGSPDRGKRIYIPVRVDVAYPMTEPASLTLLLISDSDLNEIQLAMVSLSGRAWSRPLSPVRRGTFVARRPIRIVLPEAPPGTYAIFLLAVGEQTVPSLSAVVVIPPPEKRH